MNDLLARDIVNRPDLTLQSGKLPVLGGPGLGFEPDPDAVGRAADAHGERSSGLHSAADA